MTSTQYKNHLCEAEALMRQIGEEAKRLLTKADEAGVHYCVLRGANCSNTSGDHELDLLVSSDHLMRLIDIWSETGDLVDVRRTTKHFHFQFRTTKGSSGRLIMDVVTTMSYGDSGHRFRIPHETVLLDRRRRIDAIWWPSRIDHLFHFLLHALLDKADIVESELAECSQWFGSMSSSCRERFVSEAELWLGAEVSGAIFEALTVNHVSKWSFLRSFLFRKLSERKSPLKNINSWCKSQIRKRRVLHQWPLARPVTIAFLGSDGVGKSTITQKLSDRLGARRVYMGGKGAVLPSTQLIKWVHARKKKTSNVSANEKTSSRANVEHQTGTDSVEPAEIMRSVADAAVQKIKSFTSRPVIHAHDFGEYLARYLKAMIPLRSRLVIFDRYVYDKVIWTSPPKRSMFSSPVQTILNWAYLNVFPEPDQLIVLDAPVSVLYQRNQEHSKASLGAKRKSYLSFCTEYVPSSIPTLIVNTDDDLEAILGQLKKEIWRAKLMRSRVRIWI